MGVKALTAWVFLPWAGALAGESRWIAVIIIATTREISMTFLRKQIILFVLIIINPFIIAVPAD